MCVHSTPGPAVEDTVLAGMSEQTGAVSSMAVDSCGAARALNSAFTCAGESAPSNFPFSQGSGAACAAELAVRVCAALNPRVVSAVKVRRPRRNREVLLLILSGAVGETLQLATTEPGVRIHLRQQEESIGGFPCIVLATSRGCSRRSTVGTR